MDISKVKFENTSYNLKDEISRDLLDILYKIIALIQQRLNALCIQITNISESIDNITTDLENVKNDIVVLLSSNS